MLIIRRSNCINTAYVVVFTVSDRPVCGLRRNWFQFLLNLHTGLFPVPSQPAHRTGSISFSTCTPDWIQFLPNLHTGLVPFPSQPAHRNGSISFSTCTPDWFHFLLNLHTGLVPVPSQPAHRTGSISFSTCTPDWLQFLLNLHTGRSLTGNTTTYTVLIQFDLPMMSTELLETCRGL